MNISINLEMSYLNTFDAFVFIIIHYSVSIY